MSSWLRRWLLRQAGSDPRSTGLAARLRRRRWRVIQSLLSLRGGESVLDVGGTDRSWWFAQWTGPLLRVNLRRDPRSGRAGVVGDGCALPFGNGVFDVAFSNSVIEHLATFEAQARFAAELRRVGRRYFLQTPNKWFPIEPHYLFPLFQFLPAGVQRWLHAHFNLGHFRTTKPFVTIRLLTRRELARLFPEARLVPERIGPLVKSWYVVFTGGRS